MKTACQLLYLLVVSSTAILGLWLSNNYLIALSLSFGYLCIPLLFERFVQTRTAMIGGAKKVQMKDSSIYMPFSNESGNFILTNEEDISVITLLGYSFEIKKLKAHPVIGVDVKQKALEQNYHQYVFVSRLILRATEFLAFVIAGYFIYTEQKYGYLVIPIGILIVDFLFYGIVRRMAKDITGARVLNKDKQILDTLMGFYAGVILRIPDYSNPVIDILPTGALLVRYSTEVDAPYYYLTVEERVYVEKLANEFLDIDQERKEDVEQKDSLSSN